MSAEKSWVPNQIPRKGSTALIGLVSYKKVIKNVLDKTPEVWDN